MNQVRDDRGRPVTLQTLDRASRSRKRELRRATSHGMEGIHAYAIWWFVFFGVLWAVLAAIARQALGLDVWITGAMSGGLTGVTAVIVLKRESIRRFRERRDLALLAVCCPACWYPIGEVPFEPDNCVVCPECGAAWRVPKRNESGFA